MSDKIYQVKTFVGFNAKEVDDMVNKFLSDPDIKLVSYTNMPIFDPKDPEKLAYIGSIGYCKKV